MKKNFSSVILPPILSICLASGITACGGSSSSNTNTASEDNSPSINEPSPGTGEDNNQQDQTSLASWQELLGSWDASTMTEDESDSIFVIMQENGSADYFNFNTSNSCYDKVSLPLVDQNDGTFSHQDTGYLVSFQLNAEKTEATISNNQDDTRYTITKVQLTEDQLVPLCINNQPGDGNSEQPGDGNSEQPGDGNGEQPGDGNGEQPGDGNGEQPSDGSSPATWQELLGTWDASAATEDNSDTVFVIMQENGDADYLTFDNLETCYEKTTLTLIDQGNGEFRHQDSGIVLTFTLNADQTAAQVTNSLDNSTYIITKDSQTEADLTPICGPVVVEPPVEEVFSNATFTDLISGNGIWNASTQVGEQVDVQYVAFTEGSGFFSSDKIHYIDYRNDGIDGANSDCYLVESTAIRDRGEGNFSDLKLFNPNILHLEVNQDISLLHGTYLANDASMLLNKEGVDNLTMDSFNECP